ncbi:Uncharacterised protein [Yersinia frederiksenii]|nr:Uncharacterised protein [Yersinia frederiksenii]
MYLFSFREFTALEFKFQPRVIKLRKGAQNFIYDDRNSAKLAGWLAIITKGEESLRSEVVK